MANTLDPMDLIQIINSHLAGLSNREIAETLGISRNTVNTYMRLFTSSGIELKELLKQSNASLSEMFPSCTTIVNPRYNELMVYFEKVNTARNHPGFTFLFHYNEYKMQVEHPFGYTQFMEHYRRKYAKIKGSMKLEHEAGKEVYIDFAGKKLHITNKDTGELVSVETFVAILPSSQYTYVEVCLSQKREDLIACMANALSFFGGVPKAIVSDNLKSAVTRASKYEPDINRTFKDFARHYGCVINPTRSYSPQDKALVENAVLLTYQRIYYPLRAMVFFSKEELNSEIIPLLGTYNDLLFKRKEASRKELFQSVERGYLKPLPDQEYQLKDYRKAKVQKMGYVFFSPDSNYYSAPHRFIGKDTQIEYTQKIVEVYYKHERIALHQREAGKGRYITNEEHLSSTHKAYTEWSPEYFRKMANKHGENVVSFVNGLLAQSEYPEVAYKRIMGLIQLSKAYESERLNNACLRASYGETYSYLRVKTILEKGLDKEPIDVKALENTCSHIPAHNNIRGAAAYF